MISSRAFAKVNLGLRILDRRPDNYHNIETIFASVNLFDEIDIDTTGGGIRLVCPDTHLPTNRHNLVYRAALLFMETYHLPGGLEIVLKKRIPIGGGLGGGSSDAAAVLKALARLFQIKPSDDELIGLASRLGMDVPFFVKGGAACARGRGEQLEPFRLPRLDLVICYPGFSVSTRWAYENVGPTLTKDDNWIKMLRGGLETQDLRTVRQYLANDFEPLVFRIYPELARIKERFLELGAKAALLSGSGSSVYAIVDDFSRSGVTEFLIDNRRTFFVAETM